MKTTLLALVVIVASTASPQSASRFIHITSVADHIRTNDEPAFSTPLHSKRITGTIGDVRYTLEEAAIFAFHFEVGKNYEVLKLTDKGIKIRTTDKRGREGHEDLVVLGAEEVR